MVAREIFLEEIKELGCELAEESHFDKSNDAANFAYEPLYKHLWVPVRLKILNLVPTYFLSMKSNIHVIVDEHNFA